MDSEITQNEAIRLLSPETGRKLRLARWQNIYNWQHQGWTLERLAAHFDRHPTTVVRLLKRAAQEEQKKPGFQWPVRDGKRVCDIDNPMPKDGASWQYYHPRARYLRDVRTGKLRPTVGYCPVCRKGGSGVMGGRTLMEVLCSTKA